MSLINDVLRDLDRRGAVTPLPLSQRVNAPPRRSRPTWHAVAAAIVLSGGVLAVVLVVPRWGLPDASPTEPRVLVAPDATPSELADQPDASRATRFVETPATQAMGEPSQAPSAVAEPETEVAEVDTQPERAAPAGVSEAFEPRADESRNAATQTPAQAAIGGDGAARIAEATRQPRSAALPPALDENGAPAGDRRPASPSAPRTIVAGPPIAAAEPAQPAPPQKLHRVSAISPSAFVLQQAAASRAAGRVDEAIALLEAGLRRSPDPALAKALGRLLLETGDARRAAVVLAKQPPAVRDDPAYTALLAAAWQQSGQPAQAAAAYQALLRHDSTVAQWWLGLAVAQQALGEKANALTSFRRARAAGGLAAGVLAYVDERIATLEKGS